MCVYNQNTFKCSKSIKKDNKHWKRNECKAKRGTKKTGY